jgi:hypothetical protein
MGAIAYETGGILVDNGWLRLLGSGNQKLHRDIAAWNAGRAEGFVLCGDDVLGGFVLLTEGLWERTPGRFITWRLTPCSGNLLKSDLVRSFNGVLRLSCVTSTSKKGYRMLSPIRKPCPETNA